MVLLDNDMFLTELTKLFQKSKSNGTVILTMKRYDGRKKPTPREGKPPLPKPTEYLCLLRATSHNKKISTIVNQREVTKFQTAYTNLLKNSMDGLKKLKKVKKPLKTLQ